MKSLELPPPTDQVQQPLDKPSAERLVRPLGEGLDKGYLHTTPDLPAVDVMRMEAVEHTT